MKKTMFITSVIMVVVLAIALTTSSLAWFSAGGADRVAIQSLTIATASAEKSSGLEISNGNPNGSENNTWSTSQINLRNLDESGKTAALNPMCPVNAGEDEVLGTALTVDSLYAAVNNMYTVKTYLKNGSTSTFQGEVTDSNKTAAYKDFFFIRNSGETPISSAGISVTPTFNKDRSYNAVLWVAIFDVTNTESKSLVYIENFYKVTSEEQQHSTDMAYASLLSKLNNEQPSAPVDSGATRSAVQGLVSALALPAAFYADATYASEHDGVNENDLVKTAHKLEIYAWYDGASLDSGNADTETTIALAFTTGA